MPKFLVKAIGVDLYREEVEADSEEEAREKFFEKYEEGECDIESKESYVVFSDSEEFDLIKKSVFEGSEDHEECECGHSHDKESHKNNDEEEEKTQAEDDEMDNDEDDDDEEEEEEDDSQEFVKLTSILKPLNRNDDDEEEEEEKEKQDKDSEEY